MKDADKIALAVGGSAALLSGSLIWLGLTVEESLAELRAASPDHGHRAPLASPNPSPTSVATASSVPTVDPSPPRLTQPQFDGQWRPDHAREANAKCWEAIDETMTESDPTPYFDVVVAADGRVTSVSFAPALGRRFGGLYPCVASVIETMTFPPPGMELAGRVQASRPAGIVKSKGDVRDAR